MGKQDSLLKTYILTNDHEKVDEYLNKHPDQVNARLNALYPAHWACKKGFIETVHVLINHKADFNLEDHTRNQHIPLFYCVDEKHWDLLYWIADHYKELLLCRDADGFTILHRLVEDSCIEPLKVLANNLNAWSKWQTFINLGDYDNVTPLMLAVVHKNYKIAKMLLKMGPISINDQLARRSDLKSLKFPKGFTALHIAAAYSDDKMVKLLCNNGALEIFDKSIFLKKPSQLIGTMTGSNATATSTTVEHTIQKLIANIYTINKDNKRSAVDAVETNDAVKKKKMMPVTEATPDDTFNKLFVKKKMSKKNADLEAAIFDNKADVKNNKPHPIAFDVTVMNDLPVPTSIITGSLFSLFKLGLRKFKQVQVNKDHEALFETVLRVMHSLLVDTKEYAITKVWLVNGEQMTVQRNGNTIVCKTFLKKLIAEDDVLYNAKEIGFACPLSAIYIMGALLESKEIDAFKQDLVGLMNNQLRMEKEYRLYTGMNHE